MACAALSRQAIDGPFSVMYRPSGVTAVWRLGEPHMARTAAHQAGYLDEPKTARLK